MFCSRTEMFRGIASSTNPSVSFCHRMTFSFSICSRMIGFHAFMLTLLNMLMSVECVFSFDDVRSPGPSGPRVVIDKSFCQRVWGPNRFFFKRPERADAALRARASHPARVADGKASSSGSGRLACPCTAAPARAHFGFRVVFGNFGTSQDFLLRTSPGSYCTGCVHVVVP